MRDFVFVSNLAIRAVAGGEAWRRPQTQSWLLNIKVRAGPMIANVGLSDDLQRSLNYDALATHTRGKLEAQTHRDPVALAWAAAKEIQQYIGPNLTVKIGLTSASALRRAAALEIGLDTKSPDLATLKLCGIRIPTIVGINAAERIYKQDVLIDAAFTTSKPMDAQEAVDDIAEFTEKSRWGTLESFANALAASLLQHRDAELKLTVRKPSAIALADAAGVEVSRSKENTTELRKEMEAASGFLAMDADDEYHEAARATSSQPSVNAGAVDDVTTYLGVGTNLGDRLGNIRKAIAELEKREIKVEATSQLYETEPAFVVDQPRFLNAVFRCKTHLTPPELLKAVKEIEYSVFQRVKLIENGPRPLDLDILFWDNIEWHTSELTIPHIGIRDREFVLRPLSDVCVQHPVTLEPIGALLDALASSEGATPVLATPSTVLRRDRTLMMAVLNATPDSFSDGGRLSQEGAVKLAELHLAAGASILDIGGQSTRPGAKMVSPDEELSRILPVIELLRPVASAAGAAIAVDTFSSAVAHEAIRAGADIVNDVFAGGLDPKIFSTVVDSGALYVASHARGDPSTMNQLARYEDIVGDVSAELADRIADARKAGIFDFQLIADPGLGFAKKAADDLSLIQRFGEMKSNPSFKGLAWLVGPSRKRFIGEYSDQKDPKLRGPGTAAVVTSLATHACDIVRVHDTAEIGQVIRMADAIYR